MALTKVQSEMAGTGQVLQVVNATYGTQVSTTSTTAVTTNLTASITPKFATSKILIIINSQAYQNTSNKNANYTLYKNNTTNLNSSNPFLLISAGSSTIAAPISISYLDAPATTSSTTYTLYFYADSASTAYININGCISTITLMEIAQ